MVKHESISDNDVSCYLFGSDYGCYMDDTFSQYQTHLLLF